MLHHPLILDHLPKKMIEMWEDPSTAKEKNAKQTNRSSTETKQGALDQRPQRSLELCETPSASHSSMSRSDRKSSSCGVLRSARQSISGRNPNKGFDNSQFVSYATQRWLDQTPQDEPWNAVGCSRDWYCMEKTNKASHPATRTGHGSRIAMAASEET